MLWYTIWFLIILKIPALYLAYVIWWAVKDPPAPASGLGGGRPGGSDEGPSPRRPAAHRPIPGRRPGPHGTPDRRPVLAPGRGGPTRVA